MVCAACPYPRFEIGRWSTSRRVVVPRELHSGWPLRLGLDNFSLLSSRAQPLVTGAASFGQGETNTLVGNPTVAQ